jgi:hypothetical protein
MTQITAFSGKYRVLSNFFPSQITTTYPNVLKIPGAFAFPTVEHAYQSSKPLSATDQAFIRLAKTPGIAKQLGRKTPSRRDWDAVKLEVMQYFVERKFEQNKDLRYMLLATGSSELIEGNIWNDTFWGVCRGKGENHLGKILMDIRAAHNRR